MKSTEYRVQNTVEYNRTKDRAAKTGDRMDFMSLLRHVIDESKAIKAAE